MRMLIVNPPAYKNLDFIREGRCMQTKSSWAALWMPLSLCYVAAILRNDNHVVKLVDCIAEKTDLKNLTGLAAGFKPDIVILNTAIPSIRGDMLAGAEIKRVLPATIIVVIGVFPSIYDKIILEEFPSADFAITDEPEWVIGKLINSIEASSPVSEIKGVIYRDGSNIVVNERQNLSGNNPDDLPFPARDLINNDAYRLPTNGEKFTLLSVGRGCPEKCIYCIANLYYGHRFRKRSVDKVIEEIEECVTRHKIRSFLFWGESFTADPAYGEKICDEIIRRKINISWSTTSRVDTLNPVLLGKMKNAGCILLGLGIESYDQGVLDNAGKRITTGQIDAAVSMLKKAGINSMGHFVFGLPGDTRETSEKTIKFALRNVDFAQFYCAIPYPKTKLGQMASESGWIVDHDFDDLDFTSSVMGNESMTAVEIKNIRDRAYRRFYFRPKMIIQTFREVKSVKSFFSILKFARWIRPGKG